MIRNLATSVVVFCAFGVSAQESVLSAEAAKAEEPELSVAQNSDHSESGVKALSGMSVLGNNEAPKALVIVPWKSSELGDGLGLENLLDERAKPVDKEVFMRELSYYEIRTAPVDKQP